MKAPTRLHRASARREPTCPDGPAGEENRPLCDGWAGESCRAPDPRPKNPRTPGTSRCIPGATPDAPLPQEISWAGIFANIISLRFITGKSSVARPNTHRTAADMPAAAGRRGPIKSQKRTRHANSHRAGGRLVQTPKEPSVSPSALAESQGELAKDRFNIA
jgi:hypothetical protein